MVQLIKSTQVLTQQGEIKVNITLDLNINLKSGEITINTMNSKEVEEKEKKEEETDWAIPDFSNKTKLDFGKEVKKTEEKNTI